MQKSWLREIARDLIALGSIPFYFLVMVRAIIGKYNAFVYHMIIAAISVFFLYFIVKNANLHVARSLVIVISTSLFYKESIFTAFAVLIWFLLLISAYYIKRDIGFMVRGVLIGFLSFLSGYYGAMLISNNKF